MKKILFLVMQLVFSFGFIWGIYQRAAIISVIFGILILLYLPPIHRLFDRYCINWQKLVLLTFATIYFTLLGFIKIIQIERNNGHATTDSSYSKSAPIKDVIIDQSHSKEIVESNPK